jgi:hypothetical protein
MNRREFLKSTAALAGTAGLSRWTTLPLAAADTGKSRVVEIVNPAWRDGEGRPVEAAIREMVNEAVRRVAGTDTARAAWQRLFRPDEKVGLKFNDVTGNFGNLDPILARVVTDALVDAGLSAENVYVVEVKRAEVHAWTDFTPGAEEYEVGGPEPTRLTAFVRDLDAIINLPNLKDHDRVGVTGALKNISHSRSIMTTPPNRYHEPIVGEVVCQVNLIPPLREKLRLHLMNGLFGLFDAGPCVRPASLFYRHSVFASRDPLAMDWVALEIIEEQRKEKGLPSLWTLARNPACLHRAAELGLGPKGLEQVEWERVEAG